MASQPLFTRAQWFTFPLSLRQRWWQETDYGKNDPSADLVFAIELQLAITNGRRDVGRLLGP